MYQTNMYTAKARGGPRDGVKLSAGPEWDGAVRKPQQRNNVTYYPGRYKFNPIAWHWDWFADTAARVVRRKQK